MEVGVCWFNSLHRSFQYLLLSLQYLFWRMLRYSFLFIFCRSLISLTLWNWRCLDRINDMAFRTFFKYYLVLLSAHMETRGHVENFRDTWCEISPFVMDKSKNSDPNSFFKLFPPFTSTFCNVWLCSLFGYDYIF